MFTIKRTEEFAAWLDGLKDRMTRQRLNVRLRKAMLDPNDRKWAERAKDAAA